MHWSLSIPKFAVQHDTETCYDESKRLNIKVPFLAACRPFQNLTPFDYTHTPIPPFYRVMRAQNQRIASLLETSYPPLDKNASFPWETYAQFWDELPSVTEEQRAAVEKLCPTLKTLVKSAANKKVGDLLLDSTNGVLTKFTAELIYLRDSPVCLQVVGTTGLELCFADG